MSESAQPAEPVSKRALHAFVEVVAEEEGFSEVAERLRQTLLTEDNLSEQALRRALFDDATL